MLDLWETQDEMTYKLDECSGKASTFWRDCVPGGLHRDLFTGLSAFLSETRSDA